jgi:hypothetical protein
MIDEHKAINALAKIFYRMHGYTVPEGFDFAESKHPQEQLMYDMAKEAFYFGWEDFEME